MMNLPRLRALRMVAEYGSVVAAAEVLGHTPSAVSQQLAKLERETGVELLERHGRGVRLTDTALALAGHAAQIMALVERAQADVEARSGAFVGRLTLAMFPTAARGLAPGVLRGIALRHPDLRVKLLEAEPARVVDLVARGAADLAVSQDWTGAPLAMPVPLDRAHILDDVADVAVPGTHPLAGRAEIELAALARAGWVTSPPGTVCHDWLVRTLRRGEIEPDIVHLAAEFQTQLALVAAGLGVAILPRLGRGPIPEGVRVIPVRPAATRTVYALWRPDSGRRPAIGAVVSALREMAVSSGGRPPNPRTRPPRRVPPGPRRESS